MATPTSERVSWLDQLKLIAAMLMLIDHTLSYFGGGELCFWIRATLTRAVEPLYAFIFSYLFIRSGTRINWKRYGQIAATSLCVSTIHSLHHQELRLDMLFNFLVLMPLLPWLMRLSSGVAWPLYAICTVAAAWDCQLVGVHIDYGPCLVFTQFSITVSVVRNDQQNVVTKLILSMVGILVGMMLVSWSDTMLSLNTLVAIAGHPLACGLVISAQHGWFSHCRPKAFASQCPLWFYAGHLLILHLSWVIVTKMI